MTWKIARSNPIPSRGCGGCEMIAVRFASGIHVGRVDGWCVLPAIRCAYACVLQLSPDKHDHLLLSRARICIMKLWKTIINPSAATRGGAARRGSAEAPRRLSLLARLACALSNYNYRRLIECFGWRAEGAGGRVRHKRGRCRCRCRFRKPVANRKSNTLSRPQSAKLPPARPGPATTTWPTPPKTATLRPLTAHYHTRSRQISLIYSAYVRRYITSKSII